MFWTVILTLFCSAAAISFLAVLLISLVMIILGLTNPKECNRFAITLVGILPYIFDRKLFKALQPPVEKQAELLV
jgi:hypothetical protein